MVAAHAQQLKRLEELQAELDSMQADEKLLAEAALMGDVEPAQEGALWSNPADVATGAHIRCLRPGGHMTHGSA